MDGLIMGVAACIRSLVVVVIANKGEGPFGVIGENGNVQNAFCVDASPATHAPRR